MKIRTKLCAACRTKRLADPLNQAVHEYEEEGLRVKVLPPAEIGFPFDAFVRAVYYPDRMRNERANTEY